MSKLEAGGDWALLDTSPSRLRSARSGFSLVELLVAMLILLVGIYSVAKGFPSLFGNIDAQRTRSKMVRLCERTIETLKDNASRVPEALLGHDPVTGELIAPDSEPDETALAPDGNSRDDIIEVQGEVFRVPGAHQRADGTLTPSVYPLNLGPADGDPALAPLARELVALERLTKDDYEDLPGGIVPDGTFYVDYVPPNVGRLYLPTSLTAALVDYCWVDASTPAPMSHHYVCGEYVRAGDRVRAADIVGAPAFVGVVQESCKAIGTMEYAIVLGDESDVAPITCVLEDTYGATLLFGPPEAGKVIQVDYTLRTEDDANGDPRRALMMMEEVTAPTTAPYQVDLKFAGIDDENPLYTTDMAGNPLASPVYLLVVDLQTGDAYTDADTEVQVFDMMNGKVTFDWGPADMRGHKLRIYYRTLDGHCVQVQKAPQYFVEDRLAGQYPGAEAAAVDYRTYTASPDTGDGNYTVLSFPVSAGGQAVVVDYLYGMSTPYQRAAGELHVIGYNEATDTWTIVLNNPNVQAIVGVQGVSVKVRGWWHTQRGRVQKLDLDTLLTPRSLLG